VFQKVVRDTGNRIKLYNYKYYMKRNGIHLTKYRKV